MKKYVALTLPLIVSSCMMSGDIVPTGPDTYMVSAIACPACGGTTKSITMVFKKAGEFCSSQGKYVLKSEMKNDKWFNDAGETVLEFRCLDKDHPAFIRADERRDSDTIIEHR